MTAGAARAHRFSRPLDFIFLARPTSLVPLWIFQMAGAWEATRALGRPLPAFGASPPVLLGLLSMTLLLAGGYVLNQIFDLESDRANRKLFLLADGFISLRAAWAELSALWGLAAACSLWLPGQFRLALVASLVLNVTYSTPPARIKARPFVDLLWNGLGFGATAFAAGWSCVAPLGPAWLLPGLSYTLAIGGVIASTTILDMDGDAEQGYRTTGVVLGARRTSLLAVGLLVAASAVGWLASNVLGLFAPLLSLPLMVRAHMTGRRPDRIAANQVSVAVFALMAGVRTPLLLLLLAAAYFGSRAYYSRRFNIAYPGRGTP